MNTKIVNTAVIGIVMLVVLFIAYSEIMPEAQDAGDALGDASRCADIGYFWNTTTTDCRLTNVTGTVISPGTYQVPLSGLFSGTGVVFIIVMAALIVLIVKTYLPKSK